MPPKVLKEEPPTPQQIKDICRWLKKGALPESAAARIGIDKKTFQKWLRAGNAGQPGFKEFVEGVDNALIEFETDLMSTISDNINKSLHAAMWCFNVRFGPKYKRAAEQEADPEGPAHQVVKAISEEEIAKAEAKLLGESSSQEARH